MPDNKNKPTMSLSSYLAAITDESRRRDCKAIAALVAKVTKKRATVWPTRIVGFGTHLFTYANGRDGETIRTGFASRQGNIAVYLMAGGQNQDKLLAKLGKHTMGGCCLTFRRLADIAVKVLEKLIAESWAEMNRRYPH